jgi:hypothetical protein
MLESVNPAYLAEFTNINGILTIFIATNTGTPGSWASWGDAGILWSIQNGLAMSADKSYLPNSNPLAQNASNAWKDYFRLFENTGHSNESQRAWGVAEGAGTAYGRFLAQENGRRKSSGEMLFLLIGDIYRGGLGNRQDPSTMTPGVGYVYGLIMDTTSTIPGTNIPPVAIPAYLLLR